MQFRTRALRAPWRSALPACVAALLSFFLPTQTLAQDAAPAAVIAQDAAWSAGPVHLGTGRGHRGGSRRVREVQWRLATLGYGPGRVSGRFGVAPLAAV